MTTKYVEVRFRNTQWSGVIAKVDTDLGGNDLEDAVAVPEEWMEKYFGPDAPYWEVEEVTEISKDEALRRSRQIDICTFVIDTDAPDQADTSNHDELLPQIM